MAEPVLIISPYFPPRKRVGALRAAKFVNYLPEFGFEPHIVSLDEGLPGQSVYHLSTPFDRTKTSSSSALGSGTSSHFLDRIDRLIPIDSWYLLMWWHRRKVLKFAKEKGIRLIWSTGDPWSGHLIAAYVSRIMGIPWIADWRDPWSQCAVRPLGRSKWVRKMDAAQERKWMWQATHNTFTAEETMRRYQQIYGIRASTIYNAYDQDDISEATEKSAGSVVDLVFFGRFRDLSPAEPVIRMVAACKNPARVRVVSFGSMPDTDRRLAESLGVASSFVVESPIPYDLAGERLRKADILLLSTDPRRDDIIPAKLWDYLPIGRPILSLAPNPEVSKILETTGTGVSGDAVTWLNCYLDDPRSWPVKPDPEAIKMFSAREATHQLAMLMRRLLK